MWSDYCLLRPVKGDNTDDVLQVSRIKERVEEKEGIPPVQQRLIFGGKQMYVLQSSLIPPGTDDVTKNIGRGEICNAWIPR